MRLAFGAIWRRPDGFDNIEFSGRTDRALLKEAMVACGLHNGAFEDDLRRFKRAYFRRLTSTLPSNKGEVLPGVVPFLQELTDDSDAVVNLGTGNFRNSAGMKLRHYGLDHFFTGGGFGDHVEDRALMIGAAIRAGRRIAGSRATVYVIGDTVHDITAARANNAVAVGVTTGPASEDVLSKAGADIVLATLQGAGKKLR
jgi:phosphoglycolate phosphatase-like HAD superfamily hydrolase